MPKCAKLHEVSFHNQVYTNYRTFVQLVSVLVLGSFDITLILSFDPE